MGRDSPLIPQTPPPRNPRGARPGVLSSAGLAMPDLTQIIGSWGYAAIFFIVILGNVGLPVPEETVLTVSGYLAWQGQLRVPDVIAVALVSAVAGDNLGYWLGRRYGQRLLDRLRAAAPEHVERARRFVLHHGALAVFGARFVTGLRVMAGPLAGSTGMRPARFFLANLAGAVVYIPVVVAVGYAIGYGLGDRIERLRKAMGIGERFAIVAIAIAAIMAWILLARRTRRA